MDDDKILELARRYGVQSRYIDCIAFTEKEIIAFAQSILEAEWERRKPLTDEEIVELIRNSKALEPNGILPKTFIREIEKAHGIGEKTNG